MMTKRIAMSAAALAAAGAIVGGGAAISNASNQAASGGYGGGYGTGFGQGQRGGGMDGQLGGRGGHPHTDVTGTELTKVTDAVKAKDSAITVESVRKDPDGSYDVMGTKAGHRVMVEVSKDLATIEVRTGMGGPGGTGGHRGGGMGGHAHTDVTGTELTKVTDAVKAKDSAITVESVRKDPDGSYDVMGTKAGQRVMVEVSKDLATIEVRTGGMGGPGGKGGDQAPGGTQAPDGTQAPGTSPTA